MEKCGVRIGSVTVQPDGTTRIEYACDIDDCLPKRLGLLDPQILPNIPGMSPNRKQRIGRTAASTTLPEIREGCENERGQRPQEKSKRR